MKARTFYAILLLWEVAATSIFYFGIWQHDLTAVSAVWGPGFCHPNGRFADDPFECWIWKTTVGEAYNITLFLEYVAYSMNVAAVAAAVAYQGWTIQKMQNEKKQRARLP